MAQKKNYLDKEFILRNGGLLYYNGTHFSNDTLTDKIAVAAIKKFPALKNRFLNEKERKVLEAMESGTKHVKEAQADVVNAPILDEVNELVKDEQYEDAREKAKTLVGDDQDKTLKSIDAAEEKAVEDAIKKEEAAKKEEAKKAKAEAAAKEVAAAEAKAKAEEAKADKK